MYKLTLPGSKSITNRDLILASLADGKSVLKGALFSDDTEHMIEALKSLGIKIEGDEKELIVYGGINKINGNNKELFLGNSGTSTRFLTAFSVLNKKGNITITGDDRMKKRPIGDLVDGIRQLGISVETNKGFFPIVIKGGEVENFSVKMKGNSSSQYFTAMLQIAPVLLDGLEIEVIGDLVSKPYIDITINEMGKFGVNVDNYQYNFFKVFPQSYYPQNLTIEGDASALSYFACYLALHGGKIFVDNIGYNTKQGDYNFLGSMKMFGLEYQNTADTTTIEAIGFRNISLEKYRNFSIDFENMPDVSMSFMIMSIFLPGETLITGLKTLNLKESLRIDAMRDELKKLGIKVTNTNDSITIGEYKGHKEIVEIETYNDHRIAMCFGILNTYIGNLEIKGKECVSKTYPHFWKELEKLEKNKL